MMQEAWEEAQKRATPREKLDPRYATFQERYRSDPVGFVRDCFYWKEGHAPTFYQNDILGGFVIHSRQAVRGPHGLGKTALAAWLTHWFALTRDGLDWKVITTASVWRQLTKYLWPEIHKWSRLINWRKVGRRGYNTKYELQTLQLKLSTGAAFAVASDDHTAIEGAHADCLLYIFDESKSVIDATFDAAEGAFSGAGEGSDMEALALAISTPGEPIGRFYDIHRRAPGFEDWKAIHVSVQDAIKGGRISETWVDQRRKQWGEESSVFKNRVLGEFASSDSDGVIPLEWVEQAVNRWREWKDRTDESGYRGRVTSIGADIGSGGENSNLTVLARVYENKYVTLEKWGRGGVDYATMETANKMSGLLSRYHTCDGFIDTIGIGLGVYHRLLELKIKNAFSFNSSQRTNILDKNKEFGFVNKRAAGWWLMREALDPQSGLNICLPDDDALIGELITPKYTVQAGGMIKVESKDDIMKRIERSTDSADAVIYALTGPVLSKAPKTRVYIPGEGYVY